MQDDAQEAALIEEWRGGDPRAFSRIVTLYGPAMLRVALSLSRRPQDAEEVVQDALHRAHRSLATFDPTRGSLRSWLLGVTANRARQLRRGAARYGRLLALFARDPYVVRTSPFEAHDDLAFARRRLAS